MGVVFGVGGVFSLAYQNMLSERKAEQVLRDMDNKQNEMETSQAELQTTLQEIEEKKVEEEKRMWTNDGMVKFSEILRNNTGEDLYATVISELVKYVGAKQGKIYKVNEDNKEGILELCATYSYDRFKFEDEALEAGEGLVGEAYQEGETIHITEIPDDYTKITSGLGEANPSAILIFPLRNEEVIEGIIELASFSEFQDFQIDLLHQVGVNIATTISREKINSRTSLLLEESKQQTEVMQQQEEEMRQNMEEMQATQDMMDQKENELLTEIKKLKAQMK
jgi:type II secretory pathway pseudopilin PulG